MTLRWSNFAGQSRLKSAFLFLCFWGMAAMFLGLFAHFAIGMWTTGRWPISALVVELVLLAMGVFFIVGAIGTGGITLDVQNQRAVRFIGVLFIPLLRRRYRLDPRSTVRVREDRVERRYRYYMTYTAILVSGDTHIPLRHYFERPHAEAQANRVREYLASQPG